MNTVLQSQSIVRSQGRITPQEATILLRNQAVESILSIVVAGFTAQMVSAMGSGPEALFARNIMASYNTIDSMIAIKDDIVTALNY